MSFRDQSHINSVRDALWNQSTGGASLMVGAGFSRNAEFLHSNKKAIPVWRELSDEIHNRLYPVCNETSSNPYSAATLSYGFLRLAQEFEATFGRNKLHSLIKSMISDENLLPRAVHKGFLSLPWRDVLTTNWDTLLERSRSLVVERAYGVVRVMEEIPQVARPRIVKLHGSLPAHFPLILTEEDYRTYPSEFAPFVNTVQQSMMETEFLLIGFSGEDPNFLHWSGWVRDNLGQSAPKIYLAGWLNLSSHRRRMLEQRNVISIDLAHHPKSREWPDKLRHRYATEWILATLEHGQPYDESDWPNPPSETSKPVSHYLEPVQKIASEIPRRENTDVSGRKRDEQDTTKLVKDQIKLWAHNRNLYPGWLVIPIEKNYFLSLRTDDWIKKYLTVLSNFKFEDRLKLMHEIVWRKHILMENLTDELENEAESVLSEIDCHKRTIAGNLRIELDWVAIREKWLLIALNLLTAARQRFDQEKFDKRIDELLKFQNDDRNVIHQIQHERCLWAIYLLDYKKLIDLLEDWQIDERADPVWMLRKSALLAEYGQAEKSRKLATKALANIRASTTEGKIYNASREAWTLWLTIDMNNRTEFNKRWTELSIIRCNALTEIHHYSEAAKRKEESSEASLFDLDMVKNEPRFHWSNAERERYLAAYRIIRLCEVVGFPPQVGTFGLASNFLKPAVEFISKYDFELAARLILRIINYEGDKLLQRVFSRVRIATLSSESANRLVNSCSTTIDYAINQFSVTRDRNGVFALIERIRVFLEAISRFVVRLEAEKANEVFNKSLLWYSNEKIASNPLMMQSIKNVLKRSWDTLPQSYKTGNFLDVIVVPIVGMNGFATSNSNYPEPGDALSSPKVLPPRTHENEHLWQKAVSHLIQGLTEGAEQRRRSSRRLAWLLDKNVFTDTEEREISIALWGENFSKNNHLPKGTTLYGWTFLVMPEPEQGLAEKCFRMKWLNAATYAEQSLDHISSTFFEVGNAIRSLELRERKLELSKQERNHLATLVTQWSKNLKLIPIIDPMFKTEKVHDQEILQRAILYLPVVILKIEISNSTADRMYSIVKKVQEYKIPACSVLVALIHALPERFEEIVQSFRMGLVSNEKKIANDTIRSLQFWLDVSNNSDTGPELPPYDLIREIGAIIATRRKVALATALQTARWIYLNCDTEQSNTMSELILQGLSYLLQELNYNTIEMFDENIPQLRRDVVKLALTMKEIGFDSDPVIIQWIENAKTDPLPEVWQAVSSA